MSSPIVIVGAGLAGLTLARVLHIHDIPAIVLESDPTPTARTQGGQLDIHEESGQLAVALAGLSTEFRRLVNDGADSTRVLDSSGHVLFEQGSRGVRPEVLRGDLRTMLLDSLPEDMVRWGAKVTGVTKAADSRWKLQLAGGAEVVSDLVVGADGAWSKVRPLVHDAAPTYSGTTFIESYLHDVDVRHPRAAELVGPGGMMALAPGKGIHAHREAGDLLHGYVQLTKSAEWFFSIDFGDRAAAAARVAAEFTGWAPALLDLITASDMTLVARPIYTLPTPYQWDHVRGVTLIGDAAHLMAPAGEGANLAMLDGAELGLALAQRGTVGFDEAVAGWERVMFPRSEDAALRSVFVNELTLGDGAPHAAADFFTGVSGNSVEASPAV